jgi:hypothetical protein
MPAGAGQMLQPIFLSSAPPLTSNDALSSNAYSMLREIGANADGFNWSFSAESNDRNKLLSWKPEIRFDRASDRAFASGPVELVVNFEADTKTGFPAGSTLTLETHG